MIVNNGANLAVFPYLKKCLFSLASWYLKLYDKTQKIHIPF